jgi:hypothetical protein
MAFGSSSRWLPDLGRQRQWSGQWRWWSGQWSKHCQDSSYVRSKCVASSIPDRKHDLWKGTGMFSVLVEDLARNLPVHRVNSIEHLSSLPKLAIHMDSFGRAEDKREFTWWIHGSFPVREMATSGKLVPVVCKHHFANRAILYARLGELAARTLATAPRRYLAASTGQVVGCWWTRSRWLWAGRLAEVLRELLSSCSGELRSEWRHLRAGVSDAWGTSSCSSSAWWFRLSAASRCLRRREKFVNIHSGY